jgi:hypothetical protein|tara:strand:- start:585 stop:731 length:147 start_codon:yes stop_codon:yes gene_type:complete
VTKKIKEALKIVPNIKLDEKDIEISLLELKRRVGPPKLLFSNRGRVSK